MIRRGDKVWTRATYGGTDADGYPVLTARESSVLLPASALPDAATVAAVLDAVKLLGLLADDARTFVRGDADARERAAQRYEATAATLRSWLAAQEGTGDGNE